MKTMVTTLALAAGLIVLAAGGPSSGATKRPLNACGCYGEAGNCVCERKAKCGCPGECEPKGCEEARQKQMQKEIDEETKKAKEAEAARKPKEAKPEAEDEEAKAKAAVKPMTPKLKKEFLKLIEAYLAEHPDSKNKMIWEVRDEMK